MFHPNLFRVMSFTHTPGYNDAPRFRYKVQQALRGLEGKRGDGGFQSDVECTTESIEGSGFRCWAGNRFGASRDGGALAHTPNGYSMMETIGGGTGLGVDQEAHQIWLRDTL